MALDFPPNFEKNSLESFIRSYIKEDDVLKTKEKQELVEYLIKEIKGLGSEEYGVLPQKEWERLFEKIKFKVLVEKELRSGIHRNNFEMQKYLHSLSGRKRIINEMRRYFLVNFKFMVNNQKLSSGLSSLPDKIKEEIMSKMGESNKLNNDNCALELLINSAKFEEERRLFVKYSDNFYPITNCKFFEKKINSNQN